MILLWRDFQLLVTVKLANGTQMYVSAEDSDSNRLVVRNFLKLCDEPVSFLEH